MSNGISKSRKKVIAYEILKDSGKNISATTLNKTNIFKSSDIIHPSYAGSGISAFALMDFEKMVKAYNKENKVRTPKIQIMNEHKAYLGNDFKVDYVNYYKKEIVDTILLYFKDRHAEFNQEYVSIIDFARYYLAITNVNTDIEIEETLIKREAIKQRKRLEGVKRNKEKFGGLIVRLENSGYVKKDICSLFNFDDLMTVQEYFSGSKGKKERKRKTKTIKIEAAE